MAALRCQRPRRYRPSCEDVHGGGSVSVCAPRDSRDDHGRLVGGHEGGLCHHQGGGDSTRQHGCAIGWESSCGFPVIAEAGNGSTVQCGHAEHVNVNGLEAKEGTATAAKGSAIMETIAQQLRSTERDAPAAYALQETWMTAPEGKDYWEKEHIGCLFVYSEKTMPALGRQGRGVALVLGPQMGRIWRASGSQVISSGPRHLLIDDSICGMQKEKQRE